MLTVALPLAWFYRSIQGDCSRMRHLAFSSRTDEELFFATEITGMDLFRNTSRCSAIGSMMKNASRDARRSYPLRPLICFFALCEGIGMKPMAFLQLVDRASLESLLSMMC